MNKKRIAGRSVAALEIKEKIRLISRALCISKQMCIMTKNAINDCTDDIIDIYLITNNGISYRARRTLTFIKMNLQNESFKSQVQKLLTMQSLNYVTWTATSKKD